MEKRYIIFAICLVIMQITIVVTMMKGFKMAILVSGGAGYIGSHTCVELLNSGRDIVVVDNFSNSDIEALIRVQKITEKRFPIINIDLCNKNDVFDVFENYNNIDSVIHFAGLKAVGESIEKPLDYYNNNLISTLNLLSAMEMYNINNFVFSSSATVYGMPDKMPIKETFPTGYTTNPYGTTKVFVEKILEDYCQANQYMNCIMLRYFNPIGAHESGLIGEDPNGIPNNLVPYIAQVAIGKLDRLHVYGNDYPTKDGTGIRDYIHVVDLAKGHVAAINKLEEKCGLFVCNLGTGKGYSVLEVIKAYEEASGVTIPYEVRERRLGDIAECFADTQKAFKEMGWKATLGIKEMCESSWKWQSMNPNGYKG